MDQADTSNNLAWQEQDSFAFIDYGHYFVPHRETQIQTICDLIPPHSQTFRIVELCCGEGLLAQAMLERHSSCVVHGLDGSPAMLEHAQSRLARFGARFTAEAFDLAAMTWRNGLQDVAAVVSSLAIHHLDPGQKQSLYRDVYGMLAPGGVLVIADVIEPAHELGRAVAAKAWDEAVQRRALAADGTSAAFDVFQQARWNLYHYPDPLDKPSRLFDQLTWLAQAGFVDVDVYWMAAGHALFGGRRAG